MNLEILIIDDDPVVANAFMEVLGKWGHRTEVSNRGETALDMLKKRNFDILITDLKMPGMTGFEVVKMAKKIYPNLFIIVVTAYGSVEKAVEAVKLGASEFVMKPVDFKLLKRCIDREGERLALQYENIQMKALNQDLMGKLHTSRGFGALIGRNKAMLDIYELIKNISSVEVSVLVRGETGTGKELVAWTLHQNSPRKDGPFIAVNCGSLTDTLLESELFGHEKGAFTGAVKTRLGKFELAHKGTLFLDEVGNMSPAMQRSLLRALDKKEIVRIGGQKTIPVDVRVVAATNANLEEAISKGTFRRDLYYRLNVVSIDIPPLRERIDDLPLLVEHFIRRYREKFKKDIRVVSQKALQKMMKHNWPGNVRELENLIERTIVSTNQREISDVSLDNVARPAPCPQPWLDFSSMSLEDVEKAYLDHLLTTQHGMIGICSSIAGIDPKTLYLKMKKYNLKKENYKPA